MFTEITKQHLEEVFRRYFCPETELLYEFVVDTDKDAWHHLPTPKDIAASVPNPCGWGTGMEDSVMNGGNAIDMLLAAIAQKCERDVIPENDFHMLREDGTVGRPFPTVEPD